MQTKATLLPLSFYFFFPQTSEPSTYSFRNEAPIYTYLRNLVFLLLLFLVRCCEEFGKCKLEQRKKFRAGRGQSTANRINFMGMLDLFLIPNQFGPVHRNIWSASRPTNPVKYMCLVEYIIQKFARIRKQQQSTHL